jgi:N-acetylglutamate synthase/N-acetylornithine aminotransferase
MQDAMSFADAKSIASTIARSALVKTALFGMDAIGGGYYVRRSVFFFGTNS